MTSFDLDKAPIVIRSSRGKMLLLFLVCAVFVAGGIEMIAGGAAYAGGYFVCAFFGLGVLAAAWRIVSPAWLEISANGLRWFTGVKTDEYAWSDIEGFRVYAPSVLSRHVGIVLAADSPRRTKASNFARGLAGVDGSLGGGWALGASELADLLNRAKAKWGG